jgi:DNA-binding beta-propeller fold protein YncE
MITRRKSRALVLAAAMVINTSASTRLNADTGMCGGANITLQFTDVSSSNIFFCSIAEAFFSGLTNGTTATTYSPSDPVPREQMAAFVTRTMDQSIKRASRRAALDQFWTTQGVSLAPTTVGTSPRQVKSDGADLWVANDGSATVSRVRASDGRLLETWTGASSTAGVLLAMGSVFLTGVTSPGKLYKIDPTQPAGTVATLTSGLGVSPLGIAFDGQRIWTANFGSPGSVSIVTISPVSVITVTTGFVHPFGMLYDGTNIWVSDIGDNSLKKLDSSGNIAMSVSVGPSPRFPVFDGTNIWVPNSGVSPSVSVVRATGELSGTVLATLTFNGLDIPIQAAFDGERILVTNFGDFVGVSLWKASDLTPIGTFSTASSMGPSARPYGACSDGLNFWITLDGGPGKLARF